MKSKTSEYFEQFIKTKTQRDSVADDVEDKDAFSETTVADEIDDERSFSNIFGFKPSSVIENAPDFLTIGKQGHPQAQKSFNYIMDETNKPIIVGYCMAMMRKHKPVFVGPPGAGKTILPKFLASIFELPYNRIQGSQKLTHEDLIGMLQLVEGSTKFIPGHLVRLLTEPGFLVMDEGFKNPQSVLMALQSLLERDGHLRLLGEHTKDIKIEIDPLCFLSVTDNSRGLGENSDMYGTTVQDIATLNRFEVWFEMPYLSKKSLMDLVMTWGPDIKPELANKIVTFGEMMLQAWKNGEVSVPFTPRNLQTVAEYTNDFKSPSMGIKMGFAGMLPREVEADEYEVADHVFQQVFGLSYGKL